MLPRPEAPARRLPYTTADMAERLAKKKAEQADALKTKAFTALTNYKPELDKPWYEDIGNAVVGGVKTAWENLGNSPTTLTPINMGGDAGVSLSPGGNARDVALEGPRQALRRAVGDITAIPRVGKPSPSYTADQIREQGVVPGVLGAAIDYSNFIPVVAKGVGLTNDVVNGYKLAMMERQANPFPAVRGTTNVIDVVEGARVPARVTTPAAPATRLAEAQTTRALLPASIAKSKMVMPDALAGIRDLPTLPSSLNFADFQLMPEYQQYLQAGQQLPTAKELADFGFDPERAYMVHSGPGDLVGGVLDPNFTGARNIGTKGLNTFMRENLFTNYKQADAISKSLSTGLANFEQTGIWNGPQILDNVTKLINRDAARILPVNELGLNQIINVNDMPNKEFFVGKIRNMINSYQKTVTDFGPAAKFAEQGDYLSVFPASVGTYKGAVAPTNGATYLASSPAEQITDLMGFNSVAETGVPEYQMFGQHSPLATINYGNAGSSLDVQQLAAARAFFLRKVIEDRIARGLYEPPVAPTAPKTPATRLGEALATRTLDARAAQSGVRDAGVIRIPGGEPPATPIELARLQREAARAELGVNIKDIEFPPSNNPLVKPQIIDDSGYGIFPNGSWTALGLEQYNAGINSANLPNEMSALREYFGHDYDGFQETLRNPTVSPGNIFTKKIELIDKIFRITPPTTQKFKVFRGVKTGSNYLSGDYLGAFYRSLQPGQLIVEPGYLSTSINKDIAQEWANDFADDYLLIINVPEGSVAINPITSWEQGLKELDEHFNAPTEEELLFNRGTVLKILSNDAGVINAEIVPNYGGKELPLSLSQPKEALLKQYSYKDLAEMIADEGTQIDFYVNYFEQQPDIVSLIKKPNGTGMRAYDLADTVVDLRYNTGFNPGDYWKFREIVDQITQTPAGKRASENLRNSTSKQLISLFKKHELLDPEILQFLQDNLQEILQPPPYNRLLDE